MTPNARDVLCGRGGGTRRHPGNKNYRSLINSNKPIYLISTKEDKTSISRSIVAAIREQHGQFLEQRRPPRIEGGTKDDQNQITEWFDIGDAKATEKTSQALREGQPKLRQKMIEKGIIEDTFYDSNSNRYRPNVVDVIIGLPKPSPLQAAIISTSSIPVAKPDNYNYNYNYNYNKNNNKNNEKSVVYGNSRSDLFDIDSYINIIGNNKHNYNYNHNNINNQNQNELLSPRHLSLGNHVQEKNKLMCINNNSSSSSSNYSNQYQKIHPQHHEQLIQHQQHLAVSSPYEKQQQSDYCEDDDTSISLCIATTCHHSNRTVKDLEDCLNNSIMTFDGDFDNDDDDLLDNDVDDPLALPPNHYLPTVVSDDQGNCFEDNNNNDDTDKTNTIKVVSFINKSCIYDPHIQQQMKRMWEECKSSLENEQKLHKEMQRNATTITDNYNQNKYQHHPDTNHHQHFDQHNENEHREHGNMQFTSNDFKYVMSSDYDNDYRDDDNNNNDCHDDDDDSFSLEFLSSVVFPKETTTHSYLVSGNQQHQRHSV